MGRMWHRHWVAGIGYVILMSFFFWPLLWDGTGSHAGSESGLRVDPPAYDFGRVPRLGGPGAGLLSAAVSRRDPADDPAHLDLLTVHDGYPGGSPAAEPGV